jgi:hypothetical protein
VTSAVGAIAPQPAVQAVPVVVPSQEQAELAQ